MNSLEIFIACSQSDYSHARQLMRYFYGTGVKVWGIFDLQAGDDIRKTINKHFQTASLIVPILSQDFLITENYQIALIEKLVISKNGQNLIYPIISSPCNWEYSIFQDLIEYPDKITLSPSQHKYEVDLKVHSSHILYKVFDRKSRSPILPKIEKSRPRHPYVGIKQFTREDSPIFFGREKEIPTFLTRIWSNNLTLLSGTSGVGKSSFIQAGILSNLTQEEFVYIQRSQEIGLYAQVQKVLSKNSLNRLKYLFVDQLEEVFTMPNYNILDELGDTIKLFKKLTSTTALKTILSFRIEYFSRIQEKLEEHSLDYSHYCLPALGHEGCVAAISGVNSNLYLNEKYNLHFTDNSLPDYIALDILSGSESNNPTVLLQIILREMWDIATKNNSGQPIFSIELYKSIKLNRIRDFIEDRIARIANQHTEKLLNGKFLSILLFLVSEENTSAIKTYSELSKEFKHYGQSLIIFLVSLHKVDLIRYLGNGRFKLAHDVFAPILKEMFFDSLKIGQIAKRLLIEWRKKSKSGSVEESNLYFNEQEIYIIQNGYSGMGVFTHEERLHILNSINALQSTIYLAKATDIFENLIREHFDDFNYQINICKLLLEHSLGNEEEILLKICDLIYSATKFGHFLYHPHSNVDDVKVIESLDERRKSKDGYFLNTRMNEYEHYITKLHKRENTISLNYFDNAQFINSDQNIIGVNSARAAGYVQILNIHGDVVHTYRNYFDDRQEIFTIKSTNIDDVYLITLIRSKEKLIWDFRPKGIVEFSFDSAIAKAVLLDNRLALFHLEDGSTTLYDFFGQRNLELLIEHKDQAEIYTDTEGKFVIMSYEKGGAFLYRLEDFSRTKLVDKDTIINNYILRQDHFVTLDNKGKLSLWNHQGEEMGYVQENNSNGEIFDISDCGNYIVCVFSSEKESDFPKKQELVIWDLNSFEEISRYCFENEAENYTGQIQKIEFTKHNHLHIKFKYYLPSLMSMDLLDWLFLDFFSINESKSYALGLGSNNGEYQNIWLSNKKGYLFSSHKDNTAVLWKILEDRPPKSICTMKCHENEIMNVRIYEDEQKILTCSRDKSAKLFSFEGKEIAAFLGHKDMVLDAELMDDSKYVLTASVDSTLKIWSLTGKLIGNLNKQSGLVHGFTISNNSEFILTGSRSSAVLYPTPKRIMNWIRTLDIPCLSEDEINIINIGNPDLNNFIELVNGTKNYNFLEEIDLFDALMSTSYFSGL